MTILNMNRTDEDQVIKDPFAFWLPNVMINQYMLALGEFEFDGFEEGSQATFCYVLFILATFFSQITQLNMLIAIMSNTFEKVMENRELHAIQTKLELMGELSSNIHEDTDDKKRFLYVVTPEENDLDEVGDWEGII